VSVKWKLPIYLRQDQVRDFFSVITSTRDKALFSTIYLYGLRVSEACLLHRELICSTRVSRSTSSRITLVTGRSRAV
jgi:site-specific recombinase XerD